MQQQLLNNTYWGGGVGVETKPNSMGSLKIHYLARQKPNHTRRNSWSSSFRPFGGLKEEKKGCQKKQRK